MQEIERKFLADRPPRWLEQRECREVVQGYLAVDGETEVRLRRIGERRLLTAKRGSGRSREEAEIAIDADGFERLWELTGSRRLAKRRYRVPLEGGLEAEVDVYDGELAGLLVAEVEFGSEEEADRFQPPAWFGAELTGERGYANQELALHGLPDDFASRRPSRRYRLEKGEEPGEGMRRIARGRAEKAAERLAAARRGEDPADGVHGARKDLKKLRSVLRLLRDELGEERYRIENDAYRRAGRLLSESRDAAVKTETLEALCERCAEALPAGAAEEWLALLREEGERALAATRGDSEQLAEALALVEAGRERVDSWPLESEGWRLVGPGLERAYRRGRKRMRRTAAEPSAVHVHEWRKRVKDLWYHLRLLEVATPPGLADRVEVADRLADALGDHHDLAVLRDDLLVRELPTVNRAALVAAIEARQEELAAQALALGERLYAEKPKRFAKKMRRGWRSKG